MTIEQRWHDLEEAPVGIHGHLWSPDYPDHDHHTGTVYEYDGGERGTSGPSKGMKFTKWHPFPELPTS